MNPLAGWWGLVRWSMLRHRYLLPAFTAVQIVFAVAVVVGLALLIPDVDAASARYLASGAWTLGIIAVGCVLAPQIVGTSKQEGLLGYQRTLPVARSAIILADSVVWSLAALPGIAGGLIAATLRFDLAIRVDGWLAAAIVLALFATTSIGFALAYWLPLNATGLITQIIMIGGLLFSPITFPADRLPGWANTLHQYLPFTPLGDLIREAAFRAGADVTHQLVVVGLWALIAYGAAYLALQRRG